MKKKQTPKPKQRKRKYQKRVSMYGVPLDEAIADILKSPPIPKKNERKNKARREFLMPVC